jgi:hypothetical protein
LTENLNRKPLGNRLVVYTVLIGKKAELNNIPKSMGVDYVCLTDQEDLQSNGWQIRKITSMWPADFPRSSRHPKINAHLYFNEYSRSIYVDSSVQLTVDPEKLWSKLVNSNEVVFGGIPHSFHLNMLEEIISVSKLGYESNSVLNTQVESFVGVFPEFLSTRPIWGGVLARRHNHPDCVSAMEIWFSMITEHSRRDQLSLPLALRCLKGRQIQFSYLDNKKSQFHNWPVHGHQRSSDYTKIQSEILNLGELSTQRIDSLPVNSLHVSAERDLVIAERNLVIAERDAILRTKTWRWTKFPRQLAFALKLKTGNIFRKHKKSAYKTLQNKYPEPGATIQSKILYKMAWDRNPKMRIYADKWRVRKYIKDRIGEEYLVPLLGVYRRPSSINYEKMPSEFVLKVNHGSGGVIVVSNSAPVTNTLPRDIDSVGWERFEVQPANFSPELADKLLNRWLKMDYEFRPGCNPEWAYKKIKRKILVETLIRPTENLGLIELKVYCFDGEPQIIAKQAGSVSGKSNSYYNSNWQWIEVSFHEKGVYWSKIPPGPPPKNLEKLLEIARGLSRETDFIRVDFFEDQLGSLMVGELTSYEVAGEMEYSPENFALLLGENWTPNYRIKSKPLSDVRHPRSFSG